MAGRVYLLGRPERRLGLLIHLPDVVVLDGEDDEAPRVVPQQRLVRPVALARRHLGLQKRKEKKDNIRVRRGEKSGKRLKNCAPP